MPSPRVRCHECRFEWFGPTSSHGLRIVGACPRCGGGLDFLEADGEPAAAAGPGPVERALATVSPAAVLGTPTSWATTR
jgi:hypothetical protein